MPETLTCAPCGLANKTEPLNMEKVTSLIEDLSSFDNIQEIHISTYGKRATVNFTL